ncbi:MAG TPA: type II toxin-antitoxin system RelE/ParE family toxin [Denitromonas sp.]|nr:type II toxin-antitoxin system RelE/ParE family toxin [Denitromonas sp.]
MKLIIRKEAEQTISHALAWYEQQRTGLGEHFISELEHCLGRIRQHPKLYSVAYRTIRRAPLRTFPFSVYYLANDRQITVLRVLHQRQHQPSG